MCLYKYSIAIHIIVVFSAIFCSRKWKASYTSRFLVPKHCTGERCNHHADPPSFNRQWPQWFGFPFIVYEKFEKVLIFTNKITGQPFKLLCDLHSVVVLHVVASLLDVEHVDREYTLQGEMGEL